MAKPIINTTSSVLGYLQGQTFSFQPYALNTPTSWNSSPLPAGLTLDDETGLISGAATLPGVYVVALRAVNADGASDPVIFTFGIEATSGDPTTNTIDLRVDLGTREVTPYVGIAESLFVGKYRDDLVFRVQFHRSGVGVSDLELTALKIFIKDDETAEVLAESSAFHDADDGVFLVHLALTGSDLEQALLDYEDPKGTAFPALCEFEWIATNTLGFGPADLRGSSRTFRGDIVRDLGEEA